MYKIVIFKHEETNEEIAFKILVNKEDTKDQVEQKAFYVLMNLLEDQYDAIDYYCVNIKTLWNEDSILCIKCNKKDWKIYFEGDWTCRWCGTKMPKESYQDYLKIQKNKDEENEKELSQIISQFKPVRVLNEEDTLIKYPEPCPKCKNENVFIITEDKIDSARRDPFRIIKCKDCGHQWEE